MLSLPLLIVFITVILASKWWQNRHVRKLYDKYRNGLKCWPIFGHSLYFVGSPEDRMKTVHFLGDTALKNGGSMYLWMFNKLILYTSDAADADVILSNHVYKDDCEKVFRYMGDNILFSEGTVWRSRYKVISPAYKMKPTLVADVALKNSGHLVNRLQSVVGTDFCLWDHAASYALESVAETTMGTRINVQENNRHPFPDALNIASKIVGGMVLQPWLQNEFLCKRTSIHSELTKHCKTMKDFVHEQILKRRAMVKTNQLTGEIPESETDSGKSFLDKLLSKRYAGLISEEIVKDETLAAVVAGTDTTTVTITCILWSLARYPDVQEKLYNELIQYFGDSKNPVKLSDFANLKYLDAVVKENLRMHTPVPHISRKATEKLTLPSGKTIIPGMGIFINVHGVHHNTKYWGLDVNEFKPERFLSGSTNSAFMPFSKGMRVCLGSKFSNITIKSALVNVVRRYRFKLPPGSEKTLRFTYTITTRPLLKNLVHIELRT